MTGAAVVLTVGAGCYYGKKLINAGLLHPCEFKPSSFAASKVAVKTGLGPYRKVGSRFEELANAWEKKFKKPFNGKSIGIYHDDPTSRPEEKCRSSIGVIVDDEPKEVVDFLVEQGFTVVTLPAAEGIRATFPYKGYWSTMLFLWKTYRSNGALKRYIKANPEKDSESPHYELCNAAAETQSLFIASGPPNDVVKGLVKEL